MSEIHFTNLLIVVVAAFLAPLALGFVPRLRLPMVVLEPLLGILIGSRRRPGPEAWCSERWPAAYRRSGAAPAGLETTRAALHRLQSRLRKGEPLSTAVIALDQVPPVDLNNVADVLRRQSPDQRLVSALKRGDEKAFVELVDRHHGSLVRVAQTYVRDHSIAEEVAQDTWLIVLNGLDGFQGRSSLKTWIFSILVNRAKTRGARERRQNPISRCQTPTSTPTQPTECPSTAAIASPSARQQARRAPATCKRWSTPVIPSDDGTIA